MKTLSVLMMTLVTLFSLTTKADEPQPAIDPIPAEIQPLLQIWKGGGMPYPGGLATLQLTVSRTGRVDVLRVWFPKDFGRDQGRRDSFQLPNLAPSMLRKLAATVATLKEGKLIEPTEPGCMDAPSTRYSVFKGGREFSVFEVLQCRQLPLKDESQRPAADKIRKFLDDLLEIAHRQAEGR